MDASPGIWEVSGILIHVTFANSSFRGKRFPKPFFSDRKECVELKNIFAIVHTLCNPYVVAV